jgi:hypothetical protein
MMGRFGFWYSWYPLWDHKNSGIRLVLFIFCGTLLPLFDCIVQLTQGARRNTRFFTKMRIIMEKIQRFEARAINFLFTHYKQIGLALAGCAVVALSVFGYIQYRQHAEEKAYDALAQIQYYMNAEVGKAARISDFEAVQFNTEAEKWAQVEHQTRDAINKHGNSSLRGLYLAYLAIANEHQGRKTDAIALTHEAADVIKSREVASLYQVRAALLELDEADAAVKARGIATLQALSNKADLPAQEIALYYLGEYAWTQKKFSEAQNYWSQLIHKNRKGSDTARNSMFVDRARAKLKLIKAA